jgi:hypothetical protein
MGSPALPTKAQIEELVKASALAPAFTQGVEKPITLSGETLALVEFVR